MPFDSPPPPDPDNRPWIETLHLRPPHPDHCYMSESRWARKARDEAARAARRRKSPKKRAG